MPLAAITKEAGAIEYTFGEKSKGGFVMTSEALAGAMPTHGRAMRVTRVRQSLRAEYFIGRGDLGEKR